jgi:two-component system OmpR family response regulator
MSSRLDIEKGCRPMQRRIFYVEDDDVIRSNYCEMLSEEGFDVTAYGTKEEAIAAFQGDLPDLALLDVSLHGERDAGYQVCTELRRISNEVPIIFLTSHEGEIDRISGLRVGADDYITKDSSMAYIVVRIEALFRRLEAIRSAYKHTSGSAEKDKSTGIHLDDVYSTVFWEGKKIDIPLTHFWIVKDLVDHPGKVRSHRDLMQAANLVVEPNTIAAHVKAIRDAFSESDANFDAIKTERGRGYRWVANT